MSAPAHQWCIVRIVFSIIVLRHFNGKPFSHTSTVTALQTHPHGIVVCDDEAATELRVSTYRYFKEIEREQR